MGISLCFRRISPRKLAEFQANQDEYLITDYMLEKSYALISGLSEPDDVLDLDKLYPLVKAFLNPSGDTSSLFYYAFNRGRSIIDNPDFQHGESLGVAYYYDTEEVYRIYQTMQAIPETEYVDRYRELMKDATSEEALARSDFPTYQDVIDLYLDTQHFFEVAAERHECVLRWYA